MTAPKTLSAITLQVMWNRLISVVEEQAQTLIRTAFSTSTREAGDVSAGIFDVQGRMLAQAVTGTPGHVNTMAASVAHFIAKFPIALMRPGDAFVTNDPWLGTGHLNDFVVVSPAFHAGRAVALFAATVHVVDIGGRAAPIEARQVFEEGLNIPITRLADASGMNAALLDIVTMNVREPVAVVGDLYSLVACNETGAAQLGAMMAEYRLVELDALGEFILRQTRAASLDAIGKLPFGVYRNAMTIDGVDEPIEIVAKLTIGADGIDVDFTGASPASRYAINVPVCYTQAYASFGVKCIVAPTIPNNAASLATIRVTAPAGSILNAERPAPVVSRHILGQMLPDVVMGCLERVGNRGVPAEGTSSLWSLVMTGGTGRVDAPAAATIGATPFSVVSFHAGGAGARPDLDGLSATAFPSGVRNVPIEVTEAITPILFRRKEYRVDSGGPGRMRGGLGQVIEVVNGEDAPFAIHAAFDRVIYPARGRAGGQAGRTGIVELDDGQTLRSKGTQTIAAGRTLRVEMPGGGGHGDPLARPAELVEDDVRNGFVSVGAARRDYGVVIAADGGLDRAASEALRRRTR